MKLKKVIQTAIVYAPLVYPIIKKIMDNRSKLKQAKM